MGKVWARGLGWLAGAVVAAWVVSPIAALVPAAVVDRGSGGSVRANLFQVALTVSDPFVWDCAWHSLTVAMVVASGSWAAGVGLARLVGRRRFWGRGPLWALACAPMAVAPVFGAIGLRGLLGRWDAEWPGWAWVAWAWVGLACGVPLVALAARGALARIDPTWEDAARLAGATRRQVWWTLAWPIVRPDVARAVAWVFASTLLEPGAPLVLGLRRTLAYQVVEAVLDGPHGAPRAAALTLLALAIAGLGRLLLRWWGRAAWPVPPPAAPAEPRDRLRWDRAAGLVLILAGWSALALVPPLGLLATALDGESGGPAVSGRLAALVLRIGGDAEVHRLAGRSLAVGLAAGFVGLGLARAIAAPAAQDTRVARRPGRWASVGRALGGLPNAVPPLALAVGASMLPRLLAAAADGLPTRRGLAVAGLRSLAALLDPYRDPGPLLVGVLVAIHLPMLLRAAALGLQECGGHLGDAALGLGASRWQARRTLFGLWLGSAPGAALALTVALSATQLAPALLLAPTPSGRTLGPAILLLADEPADGLRRAAALAVAASAMNLAAFALAARRRAGPFGDWFRG